MRPFRKQCVFCWSGQPQFKPWLGEYYSGTRLADNYKHEYTKSIALEYYLSTDFPVLVQVCSGLSWKSCRSWPECWEIQTSICKEMCKKLLVLTKSCWSRTDGPALVSNTAPALWLILIHMRAILQGMPLPSINKISLKIVHVIFSLNLPRGQRVNYGCTEVY